MRILLIHNFYQYWGGEDSYVTSLKKLLVEKGHDVYLYSKDSKKIKTFWDKFRTAIGLFYNPYVAKELTEVINKFKPEVAHFHNIYPLIGATAYRVCKKYSIPIIQHIHNYRFMCPKGILFRNNKICELCLHKKFPFYSIFFGCYHQSRLASLFFSAAFYYHSLIKTFSLIDKFIFPSEFTRDYYLKHLKIDKNKAFYLPYFVDLNPKNLKNNKRKGDYFLFVGRLSEEKGILQLLEVFKTLPKIKLVVIGDGPLRKEVDHYKKYPNINILGFLKREKIYNFMRKSKAVIIPSLWYEVLPIVYIEALVNDARIISLQSENFKKFGKKQRQINYRADDFASLKKAVQKFNKLECIENVKYQRIAKIKYTPKKHYVLLSRIYYC